MNATAKTAEPRPVSSWDDRRDRLANLLAKGFQDLGVPQDHAYDLADEAVAKIEADALATVRGMACATLKDPETGALTVQWTLSGDVAVGP